MTQPRMHIEGHREVRKQLREVGGKALTKEYGQVHKRIGERVIAQAGGKQTGVGAGRGASMRSSATARDIMIRVGGAHRDDRREQWGKRQVWPGGQAPKRPHVIQEAYDIQGEIMKMYEDGLADVAKKAGLKLR